MLDSVEASDTIAEVLRERRDRPAKVIVFATPGIIPRPENKWVAAEIVEPEYPPEAS